MRGMPRIHLIGERIARSPMTWPQIAQWPELLVDWRPIWGVTRCGFNILMIDRRTALQLFGATALSAAGGPAFAGDGLDLSTSEDFLTAAVKLRGSADSRLCIGWVTGTRYAVIDHEAIPMMGFLAATFSRYRKSGRDAYEAKSIEVAYFTDLADGKLLETWENPVTGKTVDVPQVRMGPASFMITAEGLKIQQAAGEAVGMNLRHRFTPAVIQGNDVWISEEIHAGGTPPGQDAKPFAYNEMTTYHGLKSDLDDPAQATVPTTVSFHGLVTWRPWMGFGDIPGHTTAHGAGARAEKIDDLPEYYLELTARHHPDVLDNPLGVLAGSEK
jgi:hypothetical protein